MKQVKRSLCLLMILFTGLLAQQKELRLEDVFLKEKTELAPQTLRQLQWVGESEWFSYIDEVDSLETLFIEDAAKGERRAVLTVNTLDEWLGQAELDTPGVFPKLRWQDKDTFWFWNSDSFLVADLKAGKVTVSFHLSRKDKNRDVAEKSMNVAFTRGNNLYIINAKGEETPVTSDSNANHVYGQEVHRKEFGIRKGTFWSPQNNYLAFYRKDESMVTDYPYINFTTRPAQLEAGKYPMAGMDNHIASVGIYDLRKKETVWLQTGKPQDQYLTNLTWSPDEKYLYIAHINRDQNFLRMVKYDIKSGQPVKTLFEEREEKYLDPQVGPYFINDNPDRFLWLSRRDGWNHFYMYDKEGEFLGQLTKGDWEVVEFAGFDKDDKYVFFTATSGNPLNRSLFRVDLKTAEMQNLTSEAGTHNVHIDKSGKYFLDEFSNLRIPGTAALFNSSGELTRVLKEAPNPLREYRMGEVKIMPIANATGDTLYCRVIFPPEFTAKRKYPLIVYVYGGPHSQQVQNTWLGGEGSWQLWLHYLATQGYIVFTVDNRGTNYRGKTFEQATFRQLGTVEIDDQLFALKYIKEYAYVDSTRIGVVGWSYGGFMAASLMLRAPEIFKVGISGAPVIDWGYYETIYTERYMDTPETNPEGYDESSALNYVGQLKGKLLLIHGTSDDIVMWQNSIIFLRAAINAGVQPDYFIYPGQKHGIKGNDRLHLFERMTGYFKENL